LFFVLSLTLIELVRAGATTDSCGRRTIDCGRIVQEHQFISTRPALIRVDTFEDPVGHLAWAAESEVIPMGVMSVAMLMGRVVTASAVLSAKKAEAVKLRYFIETPPSVSATLSGGIARAMPTVSKA
jgi:hypothetical protein